MDSNRAPRIGVNYILNTTYQLLGILIPFITAPYVSRVLGSEAIGSYSFANANASYFVIVAVFGSRLYGQNHVAISRDNKSELSKTFWEVFWFRCVSVAVCSVAYVAFIYFSHANSVLELILLISIIDVALDISWFFQGIEDFKTILIRGLIIRIVALICVFVFVKQSSDLWLYVLFSIGLPVIGNLWTWTNLKGKINYVKHINAFANFKEMWELFIPTVAIQVYLILDKSMIGFITGSDYQNGCYEQAERIARIALTVVTSIAAVILPRVATLYHKGNQDKAKELIYFGFRFTWLLALPMMFGLMMISNVFVPVFFGEGYELACILLPIFSMLILFVSLSYVSGFSFLIPIGKRIIYTLAVSIGAGVNLITNIILIPLLGAVGAAFASVLAELIGFSIQIVYCCKNDLLQWRKIFNPCWKYLIASIVMSFALFFLRLWIDVNILGLCLMLFIGVVCYFSTLFILKDTLLFRICEIIKAKMKWR